jgi:hypothetical protein
MKGEIRGFKLQWEATPRAGSSPASATDRVGTYDDSKKCGYQQFAKYGSVSHFAHCGDGPTDRGCIGRGGVEPIAILVEANNQDREAERHPVEVYQRPCRGYRIHACHVSPPRRGAGCLTLRLYSQNGATGLADFSDGKDFAEICGPKSLFTNAGEFQRIAAFSKVKTEFDRGSASYLRPSIRRKRNYATQEDEPWKSTCFH